MKGAVGNPYSVLRGGEGGVREVEENGNLL